jgi:hypothetical protein
LPQRSRCRSGRARRPIVLGCHRSRSPCIHSPLNGSPRNNTNARTAAEGARAPPAVGRCARSPRPAGRSPTPVLSPLAVPSSPAIAR